MITRPFRPTESIANWLEPFSWTCHYSWLQMVKFNLSSLRLGMAYHRVQNRRAWKYFCDFGYVSGQITQWWWWWLLPFIVVSILSYTEWFIFEKVYMKHMTFVSRSWTVKGKKRRALYSKQVPVSAEAVWLISLFHGETLACTMPT